MNINEKALYSSIGERIKSNRSRSGITQQDLADRIGMSRTSITNIEAGEQKLPLHTLYEICVFLDLEIVEVLPDLDQILIQRDHVDQLEFNGKDELPKETYNFVQHLLDELEDD